MHSENSGESWNCLLWQTVTLAAPNEPRLLGFKSLSNTFAVKLHWFCTYPEPRTVAEVTKAEAWEAPARHSLLIVLESSLLECSCHVGPKSRLFCWRETTQRCTRPHVENRGAQSSSQPNVGTWVSLANNTWGVELPGRATESWEMASNHFCLKPLHCGTAGYIAIDTRYT